MKLQQTLICCSCFVANIIKHGGDSGPRSESCSRRRVGDSHGALHDPLNKNTQGRCFPLKISLFFASKLSGWYKQVVCVSLIPNLTGSDSVCTDTDRWAGSEHSGRSKAQKQSKFSQELVCRPSRDEQNKLTGWHRLSKEAQPLRHSKISKISKPKCSKMQRALARRPAQLRYGFSRLMRTFIYRTQTKSWKRPRRSHKVILCCFTLHSAEIHRVLRDMWEINRSRHRGIRNEKSQQLEAKQRLLRKAGDPRHRRPKSCRLAVTCTRLPVQAQEKPTNVLFTLNQNGFLSLNQSSEDPRALFTLHPPRPPPHAALHPNPKDHAVSKYGKWFLQPSVCWCWRWREEAEGWIFKLILTLQESERRDRAEQFRAAVPLKCPKQESFPRAPSIF